MNYIFQHDQNQIDLSFFVFNPITLTTATDQFNTAI